MRIRVVKKGVALEAILGVLVLGLLLMLGLAACTGESEAAIGEITAPIQAEETTGSDDSDTMGSADLVDTAEATATGISTSENTAAVSDEEDGPVEAAEEIAETTEAAAVLPLLIDLGAGKCIPCKMMAPILEELAETKKDYFDVIVYDVWEDRSKGQEYGVRAIPTQIFYSARGEELYRHEGFYSREQILKKWRDLGVAVGE